MPTRGLRIAYQAIVGICTICRIFLHIKGKMKDFSQKKDSSGNAGKQEIQADSLDMIMGMMMNNGQSVR